MKPTLLVLAAGMGSRYGGLKQVDPIGPNGEILLEYSVYDALQAGFGRLVFVIRKDLEESFRSLIGSRLEGRLPVDYAFQELDSLPEGFTVPGDRVKPWGTGHAILCARGQIQEPFVAINADDFYGRSSYQLVADYLTTDSRDDCMVGFRLRNTLSEHGSVSRGVCQCSPEGWLETVVEHPTLVACGQGAISQPSGQVMTGDEVVSMNFWGFHPTLFDELESQFREFLHSRIQESKSEFYIPSVLDRRIREGRGRVKVLATPETWFGVTYPEDRPVVVSRLRALVEGGVYPSQLWS